MELPAKKSEVCKILLVDDHQVLVDGLKSMLRRDSAIQFVADTNSGEAALEWLEMHHQEIDMVLTDISMPGMSGLELTRAIKEHYPALKVIVLSMYNEPSIVNDILGAEAEGYVLKNAGKEELREAICKVMQNSSYYSADIIASLMQQRKEEKKEAEKRSIQNMLTTRELEIVELICAEMTTAEIAEKLFISPRTVDTHRKHILEKTESRSVVSLIKLAYESSLITTG